MKFYYPHRRSYSQIPIFSQTHRHLWTTPIWIEFDKHKNKRMWKIIHFLFGLNFYILHNVETFLLCDHETKFNIRIHKKNEKEEKKKQNSTKHLFKLCSALSLINRLTNERRRRKNIFCVHSCIFMTWRLDIWRHSRYFSSFFCWLHNRILSAILFYLWIFSVGDPIYI